MTLLGLILLVSPLECFSVACEAQPTMEIEIITGLTGWIAGSQLHPNIQRYVGEQECVWGFNPTPSLTHGAEGLLGENDPDSLKCCEFCVTQSKHSPEAQSAFCFIAGSLIYYECPNHFDHSIKGQPRLCLRNNGDKSWPMK